MVDDKKTTFSPSVTTLSEKYSEAVSLYATTDMTSKQIASRCGVSLSAFRVYLRRHHRDLVLRRYGVEADSNELASIKLRGRRGQTPAAYHKYKEAIEACDNLSYIEFNISQIARQFNLDGTSLSNQLKLHYPEILERREKTRVRLGLADNFLRGAHPDSVEAYAAAVELLRTTDMNLPAIAKKCGVSIGGLSQYLRFYHKELLEQKNGERQEAAQSRQPGKASGNSRIREPHPESCEKYRESLELYRTTGLTVKEIVARTGVSLGGFCNHLRKWHRDLMLERRGVVPASDCNAYELDLKQSKRYLKSTASKYAGAIESLRTTPRLLAQVASEYGFNPDTFRDYLHRHEPELAVSNAAKLRMKRKIQ